MVMSDDKPRAPLRAVGDAEADAAAAADESAEKAGAAAGADQDAARQPAAEPRADVDMRIQSSSIESLIDDHEEEVSENGETVRRRGVYLLPNLVTTGAMFCGFYAVVAAMRGDFVSAPIAILFAQVLDGIDGRVARLTNSSSKFGAEYDSLADLVSFGVAPALVMFSWALGDLGKIGWSAAFIFVACAALRLARFNTQVGVSDQNYFTGLASPPAATLMGSTVWVFNDMGFVGGELPVELGAAMALLTIVVAVLMVANIRYYSFKGLDLHGRVPFVVMFLIVLGFALVTVGPPKILLLAAATYGISGTLMALGRSRKAAA